jgi:hypothetical protein
MFFHFALVTFLFRNFQVEGQKETSNAEVEALIKHLETLVVPAFAVQLEKRFTNESFKPYLACNLKNEFHEQGINLSYLVHIASLVKNVNLRYKKFLGIFSVLETSYYLRPQ